MIHVHVTQRAPACATTHLCCYIHVHITTVHISKSTHDEILITMADSCKEGIFNYILHALRNNENI